MNKHELRMMWGSHRNSPVLVDAKAKEFMENRGYSIVDKHWLAPEWVKEYEDMEEEEYDAMIFLLVEFGYEPLIFMRKANDS